MAGLKFSWDREIEEAPARAEEVLDEKRPNAAASAFHGGVEDASQMVGSAIEYGARKLGLPRVEDWARSEVKLSKLKNRDIEAQMSRSNREAMSAPIMGATDGKQNMWATPSKSIGLKSMRMVPQILLSALPGTLLARLGAAGAVGGTAVMGGALGAGDAANSINDEIDGLSHEELMNGSKVYRKEIENGVKPEEARQTVKDMATDYAVPLAAGINAVTSAFGPEAWAAKIMGGHGVRKGLAKGLLEGVATGFPSEAIEGGTSAYFAEEAGAEHGGKQFSWSPVVAQAFEEGFLGALAGGVFGGVANVRGRKKKPVIENTAPATPDAAQTAAAAASSGKPSPTPPPGATPLASAPVAATTSVGPPVVRPPGAETPPPGSKIEKTPRNYKKATVAAGTEVVQSTAPATPDQAQAAAVAASKPLVRRRAQAELAGAAPAPAPQQAPGAAPPAVATAAPSAQPVNTPPAAAPVEQPTQQLPQQVTPPPSPPVVVKGIPSGRVLPDLQAQKRQQEEFERRAAKPDEVAGRGTRYNQPTESSPLNNREHQAWRRKMRNEVLDAEKTGGTASPIAIEANKIVSKPGVPLGEGMKKHLRDLHAKWIKENAPKPSASKELVPAETKGPKGQRGQIALPGGLVVEDSKKFVLEAARASQQANADPDVRDRLNEFQEIMQAAPNREDINEELRSHPFVIEAAVLKQKLDNNTATAEDIEKFEKAEAAFVAPTEEELNAETRDIEAGVREKGGTGQVELAAPAAEESSTLGDEIEAAQDVDEEPAGAAETEVAAKPSKFEVVEDSDEAFKKKDEEYTSKGKTVTSKFSQEEKDWLIALSNAKLRSAQAPVPSKEVQEAPRQAGEPVDRKAAVHEEPVVEPKKPRVLEDLSKKVKAKEAKKSPAKELKDTKKHIVTKNKAEARNDLINEIGRSLLELRKAARETARTASKDTAKTGKEDLRLRESFDSLQRDIKHIQNELKEKFGQAAHDRIVKQVEAALTLEGNEPTRLSAKAGTTTDELERLLSNENKRSNQIISGEKYDGTPTSEKARTVRSSTVGQLFKEIDIPRFIERTARGTDTIISQRFMSELIPRILERARDVPVHVIDDGDWVRLFGNNAGAAFYQPNGHHIMAKASKIARPTDFAYFMVHEATHAAVANSIYKDDAALEHLESIIDEIKAQIPDVAVQRDFNIDYALTHPQELIAELFSSPKVQSLMARLTISNSLARKLGLPKQGKYSVWDGFISLVRRILGLRPSDHSAMEAVVHIVQSAAGQYSNSFAPPELVAAQPHLLEKYFTEATDPFARDVAAMEKAMGEAEFTLASEMAKIIGDRTIDSLTPVERYQIKQQARKNIRNNPTLGMQRLLANAAPKDNKVPTGGARSWLLNLATLHQMTQMADRFFPKGMALKVSNVVEKMRMRRAQLISAAQDHVVTQLHKLEDKYSKTGEFAKMRDLADRATAADIHPDVPLSDPRNKHIKKTERWRFARLEHHDLHKEWMKLPADLKQAWHDARTYLTDQQNTMALLHLNNIVDTVLGRHDEQLARRIFNGTMNEADKELFRTNKFMRTVNKVQELKKIKGVYFPKMRRGDWVVTGRYKLPQWEKYKVVTPEGKKSKEAYFEFHDKDTYRKFIDDVRARGLTVLGTQSWTVEDVTNKKYYTYTDPVTGVTQLDDKTNLPKEFRFERGDTDTHQMYRVKVQDQLMEMHPSKRKVIEAYNALKGDSNYEVAGPQKRREMNVGTSPATSRQIKAALKSMEKSGSWGKMSDTQKNATRQAFLELSLSFLGSTSPQNRSRPRRNVIGASKDLVRNVAEYAAASSGTISRLENMPELGKAFEDLQNYTDENELQTEDLTIPRTVLLEKMYQNAYADDGTAPTKRNRLVNLTLTLSFMDKLISPGFHLVNMTQPWMVSAPLLGAKHGFAKGTAALGKAYVDMGFGPTLLSGIKDTKRAVTDYLEGTTDYMADLRKRLAKQKDGQELADMIDYIHEHGGIDKDAGMEVAELINAGTKGERILHRVDHVVRQFGTAVEVVNRAATAIAEYRLQREKGMSIKDAQVAAQEMVLNSQGGYSQTNAPTAFKHPLARVALQFKKFAQLQYFLLGKLTYNTFKGATTAEKIEAAKGLTALLAAHFAIAGATGLPTEPIKIPWMLLSLFFTMPSWEELEQDAVEYAQEFLGGDLGDAVMHGLPRLAGVDLNSRMGLNSLVMFGEPRDAEEDSIKAWLFDTMTGAATGLGTERIKGIRSLFAGEFGDAAEKLAPFKFLSDSVRAYRRGTEGKLNNRGEVTDEPSGLLSTDTVKRVLGFRPASEARAQEERAAYFTQAGNRKSERQELLDEYINGDRAAARQAIFKWNAKQPKDSRITAKSLENLRKRRASDRKKGYVRKGVYGGKQNKDLLDKYIGDE